MYDSKFICTYSFYDPVLRKHHSDIPFDLDDVSDFEELSELLYQGEMLKVFKIEDFNIIGSNDAIKAKITILFNMLTGHSKMVECMRKTAAFMLNDDLELGLMILFSFDYFFLTHKCIFDFLETGEITEKNMNALLKEVDK